MEVKVGLFANVPIYCTSHSPKYPYTCTAFHDEKGKKGLSKTNREYDVLKTIKKSINLKLQTHLKIGQIVRMATYFLLVCFIMLGQDILQI